MQKPCFASIKNFDVLKYYMNSNQIYADSLKEVVTIDYFPLVNKQSNRQITATAKVIEGKLTDTPGGGIELANLLGRGGVTYSEELESIDSSTKEPRTIDFNGYRFFYDAVEDIITADGGENGTCMLNGALVDGISYNLKEAKAAEAKIKVVGPGIIK